MRVCTPAGPSDTIQERVAVRPHFPVHALPAFHRWPKKQAKEFLWGIYRNMARRESRGRSRPSIALSVAVFAFEDPMITGTPNASQEARSETRRPSAAGRRGSRRVGKP